MFSILDLLPASSPIRILDLGAMLFPGEPPVYEPLLNRTACDVIGFEAVSEECDKLRSTYSERPGFEFFPWTISDGLDHTFYISSLSSRSSLYAPNIELCNQFGAFGEYMKVVRQHVVKTKRLDDVPEIGNVDWVKMDIQGAERDAINGGTETLRKAMIIETEVEFIEQYVGQPLFAEVDQSLRSLGFMFHTFLGYGTRPLKPLIPGTDPRAGFRQWLWADAVYVRDFQAFEKAEPEKLLKTACILHEIYNSFDFACRALIAYDSLCDTDLAERYFSLLEAHFGHSVGTSE